VGRRRLGRPVVRALLASCFVLRSERLLLRPWREADLASFATLNADERVMEYFPATLTRAQSDALAITLSKHIEERGFGLWAVEAPNVSPFVGFVGLHVPTFEASFTPCVEVGWRLAREAWGRGYATEAARAAIADGFRRLQLAEILAWTVPANTRSRRVMERLGMQRSQADDFDHPRLPAGHRLRHHVVYRLSAAVST
jgi:RimJ/RimL family protein N-acetyltransferase